MKLHFLPGGTVPEDQLLYVIICSRFNNNWLFVRHRERDSWELPAGHIEAGETALQAARRELFEETGALDFTIEPVYDYCIEEWKPGGCGRIYYSVISETGPLPPSEIAEVIELDSPPENLTYKLIQEEMLAMVERKFRSK